MSHSSEEPCGEIPPLGPGRPRCTQVKDHATLAPETDWTRIYHSNGTLEWRVDGADMPGPAEVAAIVRWHILNQVARRGMRAVDEAQQSWLGDGPNADIIMDLIRSTILKACGCTCSPGQMQGRPEAYPADVTCPVHGVPEPLEDAEFTRVYQIRSSAAGSIPIGHASLEAAELDFEGLADEWWIQAGSEHILETSTRIRFAGMLVTTDWETVKARRMDRPAD